MISVGLTVIALPLIAVTVPSARSPRENLGRAVANLGAKAMLFC